MAISPHHWWIRGAAPAPAVGSSEVATVSNDLLGGRPHATPVMLPSEKPTFPLPALCGRRGPLTL